MTDKASSSNVRFTVCHVADNDGMANVSDEKRLIQHLLTNYDKIGVVGRPVLNQSDTIVVKYGISLIQILDLNEKDQVLTTNVWSRYVSHRCSLF